MFLEGWEEQLLGATVLAECPASAGLRSVTLIIGCLFDHVGRMVLRSRSQRIWDETLDLIAEAGSDATLWTDVTDRLMVRTRARTGAIYVQSHHEMLQRGQATEFQHISNFDARWTERYFEHYVHLNPFLLRPEFNKSNNTMTDEDLRGELSPGEREFHEDWRVPQGFDHVIGQFLQKRREGSLTLVFWRDKGVGSYSEQERIEFDQLARAINRSVHMSDRLRAASAEIEQATLALDRLSAAIITLDSQGRIRSASPIAETILSAGDVIRSNRGHLEARHPQDQLRLRRLIADSLNAEHYAKAEEREIQIARPGSSQRITIHAISLRHHLPSFRADPGAEILLVLRIPPPSAPLAGHWTARWGLTRAETRLALLLVEPLSLADAAARLGIGRETARTHLKALFAKTGTQRQAELVIQLLSAAS